MQTPKKMLSIHTTDLCNNKCIFCIVDAPCQEKQLVSRKRIDEFLEEHRDQGYIAVNLHGGETTTRKDLIDLLEKIKSCGYPQVILQTNGRRLSNLEFAQKVYELGTTYFVVSIHGDDAITHDAITRINGSFEQAMSGIRNVKQLGATVRINTVASSMNQGHIKEIAKLLISRNVDHINLSAIHTAGSAFRNFDKVVPRYREIESEIVSTAHLVADSGVRITVEGFPYCCIQGAEDYVIEWENERFKMLYRNLVFEDYEKMMDRMHRVHGKPCMQCDRKEMCGGVYKEYAAKLGWKEFGYDYKPSKIIPEEVNAITQ
jgi:MoaA/NifB/PqqE/SkfB family radical SAM enzyme